MSNKIEITITKPKLDSNCLVKTVVCVKNPGPMADVAIKNAAPVMADALETFFTIILIES